MKNSIYKKLFLIMFLVIIISFCISLVRGTITDRMFYEQEAAVSISQSWAGQQVLVGPILRVPYREIGTRKTVDHVTKVTTEEQYRTNQAVYFNPQELSINSVSDTETRNRGIYSFPVYKSDIEITGNFILPANAGLEPEKRIEFENLIIFDVGISDRKGIANNPIIQTSNTKLETQPGKCSGLLYGCISAEHKVKSFATEQKIDFKILITLKGYKSLNIAAIGDKSEIQMNAKWANPKFIGAFSPTERKLEKDAFDAEWHLTNFATDVGSELRKCSYDEKCDFIEQLVGFELFEPINIYQQVERSIKYAILFIVLTFGSFFLFEFTTNKSIHPIQYGFIGLTQTIFYLLLISISEHIMFNQAYMVSTAACVTIIGVYLRSVLGSLSAATAYTITFALLYSFLFVLLQSEDYALLLGSLLLFVVLASAMLVTRNVDWYAIQSSNVNN